MKIKSFNRAILRELDIEIENAMQKIATKHGLTYTRGRGSFDTGTFNVKGEFKTTAGIEMSNELTNGTLEHYGLKIG